MKRRRPPVWMLLFALAPALACVESRHGGECAEDLECGDGQTCVFDLDRDTTYCSKRCEADQDCPAHQDCRTGIVENLSGATETKLCIDRVRACGVERCNGLDDDCNGVIDDAGCGLITECLDDRECGAFVCQAPENQASALCAPPVADASAGDYEACTSDGDCRNGVCEIGVCAPFCRPEPGSTGLNRSCPSNTTCARAVGSRARPKHNMCQPNCQSRADCASGTDCVWREVFQFEPNHVTVCAPLDPARKALGTACTDNNPDGGDDECAHGLCYGNVCTRVCGGPGSSCEDVGVDHLCLQTQLFYWDPERQASVELAEFLCRLP